MIKDNKLNLLKTIIIYLIYFSYTGVINTFLQFVGITNNITVLFISDLLFLLGIVFYYRRAIQKGILSFQKDYSLKEKFKVIVKWFLILTIMNIIYGAIVTVLLSPTTPLDENTKSLRTIADISSMYAIFKTLIFASIAEELLFKKAIHDIIENDRVFCIVSSIIYATVNIMYVHFTIFTIVDFIQCFIFSVLLSYCYIKNKDNIFLIMMIKFVYALFPLALMLLGVGA